jgi:hypothetical protein
MLGARTNSLEDRSIPPSTRAFGVPGAAAELDRTLELARALVDGLVLLGPVDETVRLARALAFNVVDLLEDACAH